MSFLRSLFFSTPLILLATVVMGAISLLVSFFDRSGDTLHSLSRIWARMILAVSFIHVESEGLEKIRSDRTYVFAANHSSYMDIPAILSQIPHQFRFFAKQALYRIPFLGTHLARAGHLPVDRSSPRASLKSMSAGARIIAERGVSVLLFPEGGRSPLGLRDFREGAAYIAIKSGAPLAPIGISGMRQLLPMGSIHLRSGRVKLRVGDPIPTAGLKLSDRAALTQRLWEEIARLAEEQSPAAVR